MHYENITVSLPDIQVNDPSFLITTDSGIDRLAQSIDTVGLLRPPILIQKETYCIVSGFRRITACRFLNYPTIQALVLNPSTEPLECVRIAITENAFQRPLNPVEQSRCLKMLVPFFSRLEDLSREASKLGIPDHPSLIRKLLPIADFPLPVQQAIVTGVVPVAMVSELNRLDPQSQLILTGITEQLKLSLNKQRELLILAEEIALRDNRSLPEVFQDSAIRQMLSDETDRNQKYIRIRSYLRQKRFPAITEAETAFEHLRSSLVPENGIQLIPPSGFETRVYTLHLTFQNRSELAERRSGLDRLLHHPSLDHLWNLSEQPTSTLS